MSKQAMRTSPSRLQNWLSLMSTDPCDVQRTMCMGAVISRLAMLVAALVRIGVRGAILRTVVTTCGRGMVRSDRISVVINYARAVMPPGPDTTSTIERSRIGSPAAVGHGCYRRYNDFDLTDTRRSACALRYV